MKKKFNIIGLIFWTVLVIVAVSLAGKPSIGEYLVSPGVGIIVWAICKYIFFKIIPIIGPLLGKLLSFADVWKQVEIVEEGKTPEIKTEEVSASSWSGKLVREATTEVLGFDLPTHETDFEIDRNGNILTPSGEIIGYATPKGKLYENREGIKASKRINKQIGYIAGDTWFNANHEQIGKWWKR